MPLRKFGIICLLFLYLSSATQLHEIFKLPLLIEHFVEHSRANHNLSFWEFLEMHYAHGDVRYADYDKDMQLPFKSHEACINFITGFSTIPNYPQLIEPTDFEQTIFVEYNSSIISSSYLDKIWQPPKSC